MRWSTLARSGVIIAGLGVAASLAAAHDLYIKFDTYFLAPETRVRVPVLNGTFVKSEGAVTADRVSDLSVVSAGRRARLSTTLWTPSGDTTVLTLRTGEAGTYVVGASTRPRELALSATDFNEYLEHDGIPDVLAARRRDGQLATDVVERYHKHVKAVFQVGDRRTDDFGTVLGYPAEIIPLENPYAVRVGAALPVRVLVDGVAVANQVVVAGGHGSGGAIRERSTRADDEGIARVSLDAAGRWYVKFIYMERSPDAGIDYESKWATLTFEVR